MTETSKKNLNIRFHFDICSTFDPVALKNYWLLQVGDISYTSSFTSEVHLQTCYEISYIVSGSGKFVLDNREYSVRQGDIIVARLGQEHYICSSAYDPIRFFYVGFLFEPQAASAAEYAEIIALFDDPKYTLIHDQYDISSAFFDLLNEFLSEKPLKWMITESCLERLIGLTYRNFLQMKKETYVQNEHWNDASRVLYEIINYVDRNVRKIRHMNEISQHLGYSYPYVSNLFSENMGITLKEYVDDKKIEYAKTLLYKGSVITEVAEAAGYDSIHAFSRAFKRKTGLSPMAYCQQRGEENPSEVGSLHNRMR